jgi:uncharacterized protein YbjQ (UPF0145 family)
MTDRTDAAASLPAEALTRLRELEGGPGVKPLFTSDLSVNEFLLVEDAGFEPLGLVLGSSIYHVGIQVVRWTASQELDVLTRAMYHARELAMARMEAEAAELGADGIVGVRLDIRFYEWGNNLAEFVAIRPQRPGLLDPPADRQPAVGPGHRQLRLPRGPPLGRPEEANHVWGHHAIEFLAIGTAVDRFRERGSIPRPRLVLTLDE